VKECKGIQHKYHEKSLEKYARKEDRYAPKMRYRARNGKAKRNCARNLEKIVQRIELREGIQHIEMQPKSEICMEDRIW
jgi:hypothetical protein